MKSIRLTVLLVLAATAASANQLIVLTDGTIIESTTAPVLRGELVMLTLPNGLLTSIRADRIESTTLLPERLPPKAEPGPDGSSQAKRIPMHDDTPHTLDNATLDAFMARLPTTTLPTTGGSLTFAAQSDEADPVPIAAPAASLIILERAQAYRAERARPAPRLASA